MGVADVFLCFPDHSSHLPNQLSTRRLTNINVLASGFQLGLLDREHQQQISSMREREVEIFVPLVFPLWCQKEVAMSLHQGLCSFQTVPSIHPSLPLGSANCFTPSVLVEVTAPLLIALGFCITSYDFSLLHMQTFVNTSSLH